MSLTIRWKGEDLVLLPERAIYWPDQDSLLIADLHIAKGATLREAGIPVPPGSSQRTLDRLSKLIEHHRPAQILVLGDLFHGREAANPENLMLFETWKQSVNVPILLVAGNHDRWVKLDEFGLVSHNYCDLGPFRLSHQPIQCDRPVVCGHIHPGVLLSGRGRQIEKIACFWVQADQIVLPAFGELTGLYLVEPRAGDNIYIPVGARVLQVPSRQ